MGISSRSRTAFPPAEVSLERGAALPVTPQSMPPSARVSNIDGFSWVIGEPIRDVLDEQFLSLDMMSSWVTWVFTLGLMGFEFVFHRSRTEKLSPDVSVSFLHAKRSLAAKEILMPVVTGQSLLTTIHTPLRGSRIGWVTWRVRRSRRRT